MQEFFSVLAPRRVHIHAELGDVVEAQLRQPTLSDLADSVDELISEIESSGGLADVYVYYAGHGRMEYRGALPATSVFLRGEDGAPSSVPARDFIATILEPLDRTAGVRTHLVVDACQSFYVIEPRGEMAFAKRVTKVATTSQEAYEYFTSRFPTTGAVLATNGNQLTWEDPELGGLFSYAVRSAGIGQADVDGDGNITYREIAHVTQQVLGPRAAVNPPGIVPPGGDPEAIFLPLRASPAAAEVCFDGWGADRLELLTAEKLHYAVLNPPLGSASSIYLTTGRHYFVRNSNAGAGDDWKRLDARTDRFDRLLGPSSSVSSRGTYDRRLLAKPVDRSIPAGLFQPPPPEISRHYIDVALFGSFDYFLDLPEIGLMVAPGVGTVLTYGVDQHQLAVRASFTRAHGAVQEKNLDYVARVYAGDLMYHRVLHSGRFELSWGGFGGAGALDQRLINGDRAWSLMMRAGTAAGVLWPLVAGSRLALSVRAELGGQVICAEGCGAPLVSPFAGAALGIHWELPLMD